MAFLNMRAVAVVIFLLLAAAPAWAQTDLSGLSMKPGDWVWITPPSGATFGGTLTALSATTLSVNGRDVRLEPGLQISREGDSLWNGFLIAAAIGIATATTIGAEACLHKGLWCQTVGVIEFGAIGAFIDWRHKGRTIVFEVPAGTKPAVRLVPAIAPGRKTLGLVVSF